MALRDKLEDRARPYLQPGEEVQAVAMGQTGLSPYWILLSNLVVFFSGYRHIIFTDRAIHVLKANWMNKPTRELALLPRQTIVGPLSGLWGKTMLGNETTYINKRFHRDIERADALAGAASAPSSAPSPPPTR